MKKMFIRFLVLFLCIESVMIGFTTLFTRHVLSASPKATYDRISEGEKLSKEQAQQLEASLLTKPDNIETREKLIGFYGRKKDWSSSTKQMLWLIHNHPEAEVLSMGEAPPWERATLLKAWEEEYQKHSDRSPLIEGYINALPTRDPKIKMLCERGQALQPDQGIWSSRLAGYYETLAEKQPRPEHQKMLKLALDATERALELKNSSSAVGQLKAKQADLALLLGDYEKARRLSQKMLSEAGSGVPKAFNGLRVMGVIDEDVIHHAHLRLGRIALLQNDRETAKRELLEAANVSGSPVLSSFGPNMTLAKELLEKGEKDAVLQYFERCRKFWSYHADYLDKWTAEVKRGTMPDFGANLLY